MLKICNWTVPHGSSRSDKRCIEAGFRLLLRLFANFLVISSSFRSSSSISRSHDFSAQSSCDIRRLSGGLISSRLIVLTLLPRRLSRDCNESLLLPNDTLESRLLLRDTFDSRLFWLSFCFTHSS